MIFGLQQLKMLMMELLRVGIGRKWKASKDGMMRIYSFDSNSDKKPQSTLTLTRLDQDNQFVFFDDNMILELKQGGGIF